MKSTILLVLIIIGAAFYMNSNELTLENLEELIGTHKILAPILFSVIYIISILILFPSTVFFLSGGFLFGHLLGSLIILISSTLGAVFCFLIGRFLLRDWITIKFGKKTYTFMKRVDSDGWKFVALLRLVLVVPFGLSSYVLGVTNISLFLFTVTTLIAEIPAVVCYSYLGSLSHEVIKGGFDNFAIKFLFALALISFLFAIPLIIKYIKLAKNSDPDDLSD